MSIEAYLRDVYDIHYQSADESWNDITKVFQKIIQTIIRKIKELVRIISDALSFYKKNRIEQKVKKLQTLPRVYFMLPTDITIRVEKLCDIIVDSTNIMNVGLNVTEDVFKTIQNIDAVPFSMKGYASEYEQLIKIWDKFIENTNYADIIFSNDPVEYPAEKVQEIAQMTILFNAKFFQAREVLIKTQNELMNLYAKSKEEFWIKRLDNEAQSYLSTTEMDKLEWALATYGTLQKFINFGTLVSQEAISVSLRMYGYIERTEK